MNRNIKYFLSFIFIFSIHLCFPQQNETNTKKKVIDSLCSLLKALDSSPSAEFTPSIKTERTDEKSDTIRINTLNELAWEWMYNNPDTAITLSTQALNLAIALFRNNTISPSLEIAKQRYVAKSYSSLGVFNWIKSNYAISLDYYFKALKIRESLKEKKAICAALGNIAVVYSNQANYPQALDYYLKSLKISEELGNNNLVAQNLGNIGIIYYEQKNYPKALDYYSKALKMDEESKDEIGITANLASLGIVYCDMGEYNKALDYDFKVLKKDEELGNTDRIASHLANIGIIYDEQGNKAMSIQNIVKADSLFEKALSYYFKALKIAETLGDKSIIATDLGNIGTIFVKIKKTAEAEKYLQKALTISTEINALDLIKSHQNSLSELYERMNQPAKALEHYKKYIEARDSLFNEDNTKKIVRSEMNFEFEKKQAIEKEEQEKQNAIAQQEKQKQKIILILVSFFLLIVIVFASFMFSRWRITQKQKLVIEKQKEKIVDSITYAQLIQQSILLEESEIQKYLPECFICFQPKDIVSGDFYWCSKINDKIILAAVDCNGHGVPGAFMSMIGNTLLNQIVNEKQITKPSEILKLLNQEVIESLHQSKNGALSKDGMAIALCSIDYKNNQLEYAGAENPLYILANNEITVVNADSHGIGSGGLVAKKKHTSSTEYMNHIITMEKGMSIFLFSDGYMDQFGGNERKKFGIQKFKELLLNNQHLTMQKQKELIAKAHQDWKGSATQTDDILVIGLKL
jgi:serine phosphatase RsbU (regulator of sigma subunit)